MWLGPYKNFKSIETQWVQVIKFLILSKNNKKEWGDFMDNETYYIKFIPIQCPKCHKSTFVLAEDGKQDFECECGFKDTLTIESIKE